MTNSDDEYSASNVVAADAPDTVSSRRRMCRHEDVDRSVASCMIVLADGVPMTSGFRRETPKSAIKGLGRDGEV